MIAGHIRDIVPTIQLLVAINGKKIAKNVCRKRNTLQVSSRIIHTITMKEKRVYLHP